MRIAYLCADRGVPVGGFKGATIHVRGVAEALARRGHDVHLLAARDGNLPEGFTPRTTIFGFDPLLRDLRYAIAAGNGGRLLAGETHGFGLNIAATEALVGAERHGPIDAIYERLSLWSLAGLRFARSRGIPWILEVNAPLVEEQARYRDLGLRPLASALEGILLREADAIIVPAEELKDHIRRRTGRVRRISVIPNGVDLDLFASPAPAPAEAAARLKGRFVIAFCGSLKPWHGIEILVRAFKRARRRIPEAHLLIIGDGPMRSFLQEAAAETGADSMTITGGVPHAQVPSWLACADVGVAPYPRLSDFYFSPLKIVEYMAAGLPVVASDLGQIPDLLRGGEMGLLVPAGRVKPLAEAFTILHSNTRLRRRMASRSVRIATRRHGWDRVAEKTERILRGRCRALESRRRSRSRPRRDAPRRPVPVRCGS